MEQNKTGKYIKYAVGEIVLVVIGILIAVGINSRYNEVQNEKKIQSIFIQIQNELLTDIKDAKRIFNEYITKDSLSRNVLNDRLTKEEFLDNPYSIFFKSNYVSFSNKKTGHEQLMNNIENLPDKYKELLPYFNDLFREQQNEIDDYNEEIKSTVFGDMKKTLETEPDAYKRMLGNYSEEYVDKILSNPYLKNSIAKYMNNLGNITRAANEYRATSIVLYKKIDSLLGKESETENELLVTAPPKEKIASYLGTYLGPHESENQPKMSLEFVNNQLELSVEGRDNIVYYWDGGEYYYAVGERGLNRIYTNNHGQHVIQFSNGLIELTFIKEDDLKNDLIEDQAFIEK